MRLLSERAERARETGPDTKNSMQQSLNRAKLARADIHPYLPVPTDPQSPPTDLTCRLVTPLGILPRTPIRLGPHHINDASLLPHPGPQPPVRKPAPPRTEQLPPSETLFHAQVQPSRPSLAAESHHQQFLRHEWMDGWMGGWVTVTSRFVLPGMNDQGNVEKGHGRTDCLTA